MLAETESLVFNLDLYSAVPPWKMTAAPKNLKQSWSLAESSSSYAGVAERRDLAVDFVLCLVLIEVLKQLAVHPGHDELVHTIEDLAFKHFRHRDGVQTNPNCANINVVADLYAEVVGVLAQSRFQSVRRRFMVELKELRSRESCAHTTHNIMALLMGMKFFRVKMVPIEEFEASFQFMQECAQYFLEVRDKDIKHALAGLFVEILVPVAAAVKNEVNVPCLKNFVEMLYSSTLDTATKNKHKLAIFPLLTCLLCVSQKNFFLSNWHYFLTMCLQHLKNRDPKMARVALESLYRLLWVYMIRIKCESNSATHSRLASIVNSLFPKGSKTVVPRDTPLNIFVKIIQFIAQERLDFAMRDIVFDLLSVGRPIKVILSPERMAIGLRAFLVVADSLQQKEGDPPMPRTLAVLPSGNTLRVKKTFLSKMLTEDTARNIGLASYYPLVRKTFNDMLKALDTQFGKPLMMTNTHNVNKEPDELIGGERKAKMDLFRTCVAAVPRLIPDGMSGQELVELLARLTAHMDEELRGLALQSLQALVIDFPEWRHEVIHGYIQFIIRDVGDAFPQLVDASLRMLLQLYMAWRSALCASSSAAVTVSTRTPPHLQQLQSLQLHQRGDDLDMVCMGEAVSLVMLCCCRSPPRRLAVLLLKELKLLTASLACTPPLHSPLYDCLDKYCSSVVESVSNQVAATERSGCAGVAACGSVGSTDLQWLAERTSNVWTGGTSDVDKTTGNVPQPDVWPQVLLGFMLPERVLSQCPRVVAHAWPLIYTRAANLYPTIDPLQPNDNRASLLRSATTLKKPVCERDLYLNLWRNYVVLACRVVPSVASVSASVASSSISATVSSASSTPVQQRCASPDISVGNLIPVYLLPLLVPPALLSPRLLPTPLSGLARPALVYPKPLPCGEPETPHPTQPNPTLSLPPTPPPNPSPPPLPSRRPQHHQSPLLPTHSPYSNITATVSSIALLNSPTSCSSLCSHNRYPGNKTLPLLETSPLFPSIPSSVTTVRRTDVAGEVCVQSPPQLISQICSPQQPHNPLAGLLPQGQCPFTLYLLPSSYPPRTLSPPSRLPAEQATATGPNGDSSPDSGVSSGGGGTGGSGGGGVAPPQLYKLLVPLLRCDLVEVRDVASLALGNINHHALGDVMEELVGNVRESLDRKQENMRRRRRRDALRLQLMRLFHAAAAAQTFALSDSVLDSDTGSLLKHYLDYLDGARCYLESDWDRENVLLSQIKFLFCKFVRKLLKSFTRELLC
ncbi:Cell morphogenesis protein N-terminal [Trinorchestia longiramus]|nr:Cell morphogenesis protein N-terminal [Trinorchestia longiramus]